MDKRKRRLWLIIILIIVGISVIGGILYYYLVGEFNVIELIRLSATLVGFVTVYLEFNRSRNLDEANFITNLNKQFSDDNRIQDLYSVINNLTNDQLLNYFYSKEIDKQKIQCLTKQDIQNSVNFLSFFESIYLLIERKIVNIDTINDLFAARFFKITNNPMIQDQKLVKDRHLHQNIYRLHKDWLNYRIDNKYEAILHKTSLANYYKTDKLNYFTEPVTFCNKDIYLDLQEVVYNSLEDKTIFNPIKEQDLDKMIVDLKNKCYLLYEKTPAGKKYIASSILSTASHADHVLTNKFKDIYYEEEIFYIRSVMVDSNYRGQSLQNLLVEKMIKDAIYLKGKVIVLAVDERNFVSIKNFLKNKFVLDEFDINLKGLKRKYMYKIL